MSEDVLLEAGREMEKILNSLSIDFGRIRTGRASLTILDGVRVDYYGVSTPLNQMAGISIPESRLIMIQPWDKKAMVDVEKAILKSDLGLTPVSDGKIIRITIPTLTEERRNELIKRVRKISEDYKVRLRNIRRQENEFFKEMKKEKEISEDEMFRDQKELQEITDKFTEKIEGLLKQKEDEILEI